MPTKERKEKIERAVHNRQAGIVVVLEDMYDPHNVGAVMRTCDAFGVHEIHAVYDKQEKVDLKKAGKQTSTSASKWISVKYHDSIENCASYLKNKGYTIVGTVPDETAKNIFHCDLLEDEKIAFLVGNEHEGLSEKALKVSDKKVHIPMTGMVQSLNVSVVTAILVFEATRQRVEGNKWRGFSQEEKDDLIKEWSRS